MYTFSHTSSSHQCSDPFLARSYMTASCLRSVVCISYFPLQGFSDTKAWEAEGTEPIGHSDGIIWKCRAGNTVGPLLTNGEQELMDECFLLLYLGQIPERCFIRLLQGSCRTEHVTCSLGQVILAFGFSPVPRPPALWDHFPNKLLCMEAFVLGSFGKNL